MIIYSLFME